MPYDPYRSSSYTAPNSANPDSDKSGLSISGSAEHGHSYSSYAQNFNLVGEVTIGQGAAGHYSQHGESPSPRAVPGRRSLRPLAPYPRAHQSHHTAFMAYLKDQLSSVEPPFPLSRAEREASKHNHGRNGARESPRQ